MLRRGLRISLLAGACLAATAPARADTLKDALNAAYRTNPTLEGARAQQRATDENVPIQKSNALPNVSATGSYTEYLKQSSSSFVSPARSAVGQLNLSVPIYQGGATKNGIRAAETRDIAGRATLRGSESSLFSQVVGAYMDVILDEAVVGLNANNVHVLQVNLESTQDQFQIGQLTRTDVAQSQSRLALAQGDLRTAQSNLVSARERYVQLVGKAPSDLQPPPPLPGLPGVVNDAVKDALQNNPDLIAAQENPTPPGSTSRRPAQPAAEGELVRQRRRDRLPRFPRLQHHRPGPAVADDRASRRPADLPLYQGGRPAAQERQAQDRASQALEQVVATERNVIQQVRSAYSAWQASQGDHRFEPDRGVRRRAEPRRHARRAERRHPADHRHAQRRAGAAPGASRNLVTARRNAYVAGFTLLAAMGRAEARDLGLDDQGPLYDPVVNYDRVKNKFNWDWSFDPDPVTQSTRTVDIPPQDAEIPAQQQQVGTAQ